MTLQQGIAIVPEAEIDCDFPVNIHSMLSAKLVLAADFSRGALPEVVGALPPEVFLYTGIFRAANASDTVFFKIR